MRGRKPKPPELKVLAGERADRRNDSAPRRQGKAEPPGHLDDDGRAKWEELAPKFERSGVLSETDADALAIYCVAFSRWLQARHELDLHGLVIMTDLGGVKANPAASVVKACEDTMRAVLASFGADPASRGKVSAKGEGPPDDFAAFMSRRKA